MKRNKQDIYYGKNITLVVITIGILLHFLCKLVGDEDEIVLITSFIIGYLFWYIDYKIIISKYL